MARPIPESRRASGDGPVRAGRRDEVRAAPERDEVAREDEGARRVEEAVALLERLVGEDPARDDPDERGRDGAGVRVAMLGRLPPTSPTGPVRHTGTARCRGRLGWWIERRRPGPSA